MEGMARYPAHPARDVSVRSMTAVENGDREGWLSLFTEDSIVEDPIGPSSFDPEGKGQRGIGAIADFWDDVISQAPVRFAIRESYAAGNESANVGTLTIHIDGGSHAFVAGVFTSPTDEAAKLAALRALRPQGTMPIERPASG